MVSSRAYPDLDRSPKKNWVEKAGGLPSYIERVAKHIHYEGGKEISRAIAMAISQVKKWAAQGKAEAIKAVAQWEKMKASGHGKAAVQLSAERIIREVIELSIVEDKTGRQPPGEKTRFAIARLRAKVRAGTATAADRAKLARLEGGKKPSVELSYSQEGARSTSRGPYTSHVTHTKQFGRKKGNLKKPADWRHQYKPLNQISGAIKAKHIAKSDLDSSGKPQAGKSDEVKKPLPASAAIAGVGRKEQHTGDEHAKAGKQPAAKSVTKSPDQAKTTLRSRRNALQRKKTAGTITPLERRELSSVIGKLKN